MMPFEMDIAINGVMALLPVLSLSAGIILLLRNLGLPKEGRNHFKPIMLTLAWVLVGLGLALSILRFGVEFGLAIALLQLSALALVGVASQAQFKPVNHAVVASEYIPLSSSKRKRLVLFFIAGPYSVVTSCVISMAIALILPTSRINQMAFVAIFYPVLLGIISYLICFRKTLLRDTIYLSLAACLSAISIFNL